MKGRDSIVGLAAISALFLALSAGAQELMRSPDGKLMGKVLGQWTELAPSKFCAKPPPNYSDTSACRELAADEFLPLSVDEFVALTNEYATLSGCVLQYELRDPKPDFFGNNMDDKLWRKAVRGGHAKGMFAEASRLPGFISPQEVAALSDGAMKKRFPEVIWSLQNYSMAAGRKQIESLRAQAVYQKYTALGTEGECVPSETFVRLLQKSDQP